jgi:hypothetical protein
MGRRRLTGLSKTPGKAIFLQDYAIRTVQRGNFHHLGGVDRLLFVDVSSLAVACLPARGEDELVAEGHGGDNNSALGASFVDLLAPTVKDPSRRHPRETSAGLLERKR